MAFTNVNKHTNSCVTVINVYPHVHKHNQRDCTISKYKCKVNRRYGIRDVVYDIWMNKHLLLYHITSYSSDKKHLCYTKTMLCIFLKNESAMFVKIQDKWINELLVSWYFNFLDDYIQSDLYVLTIISMSGFYLWFSSILIVQRISAIWVNNLWLQF